MLGRVEFRVDDPTQTLHELTAWALGRNLRLEALEVIRPSLEDVYLQITEQAAADEGPA